MILKIMLDRKGEYVLYDGITSIQKQSGRAVRRPAIPCETTLEEAVVNGATPVPEWLVSFETDRCSAEIEYDGLWIEDNPVRGSNGVPVSILYLNKGNETFAFVVSEAYILNDAGATIQVIRN